ncbi:MAG: NAD(P)-dependent oxidoreductase [Ignavibacteriales bacterium]|nr:NAD(P)-dependent oxidoreductase [Ignavibacteriales bacterium]
MRILVTGGSGLVGRYVVEELKLTHHVEILDLKRPDRSLLPYHPVDLLDEGETREHVRGFGVVVHLAGIPHPLNDSPEKVFRTNTQSTYNLLEACAANGVRRFVFISSESVLGFAFSTTRMWPEFLPMDERHALRPQDPYGLSKVACEQVCNGFTRRTGMQTICLRPPWVWVPEPKEVEFYKQLRAEYPKWYKNLWAYIHVFDVAKAVRQCVESPDLPAHDSFFICASETWVDVESKALVAQYFPETRRIADSFTGKASLISCEKAKRAFGFSPLYSWRDIIP